MSPDKLPPDKGIMKEPPRSFLRGSYFAKLHRIIVITAELPASFYHSSDCAKLSNFLRLPNNRILFFYVIGTVSVI